MQTATPPESAMDLFTEAALCDPYPLYEELRAAGPAVRLTELDIWALSRYGESRDVLRDWEVFSSTHGVMLNDAVNDVIGGKAIICSDPPRHTDMRRVLRRPLMMDALRELAPSLKAEADALVERLVERGSFDAVTDFAQHLPLTIVAELVGLPAGGREQMLPWASATFDAMGPMNERTEAAIPAMLEMLDYGNTKAVPPYLKPGGWAQRVYDAADRGELAPELCPSMMSGYLAPSLDTTINGIGSAMLLLGEHPDQFRLLREDPALIPNAVNEVLRLESPIQRFTRHVTQDTTIGDTAVPAGARVMVLYGSCNRDERRWEDPTRFDVQRPRVAEHLAFGNGTHACVGSGLARMEMRLLLEAFTARVERFEVSKPARATNQVLRGLASLQVTVTA